MYPQIIPIGEENIHIPVQGCPCGPKLVYHSRAEWMLHRSYDKRYVWLAVEKLMGITCYEHGLFVTALYVKGEPHSHQDRPPLHFEYSHKKIDPR